ncbi:MAG: polysaccharide deacetylase family protein [Ferruginibacter sp.]
MSPLKKIFYQANNVFPLSFLKKISPIHTLLPYHHTVSDQHLPHIKHLYPYKNVAQFTTDLDILLKNYKIVTPADLLKSIEDNNILPKNTFLISFDDGFREVYDIIAPILEQKGVPAIFFINPAFIDNKRLFFRSKSSLLIDHLLNKKDDNEIIRIYADTLSIKDATVSEIITTIKNIKINNAAVIDNLAGKTGYSFEKFLAEQKPFLTTENLAALQKRGFTIGGHSMTHPYYQQLNLQEQLNETINSCKFIKDNTGMEKMYFSFPYSDEGLSQDLFDNILKEDIDLLFGIQNQKNELNNKMLHRFNAERPDIDFEKQLKGLLTLNAVKKIAGKNSVKRN